MTVRRPHPYTLLDVFTDVPLVGNALAVVHDADDVDEDTMLRFARETRLSETSFVQSPDAPGADYRNRILTVAEEIPFAGHPSLGVAWAVARRRGDASARYVQQTGVGLQPVDVQVDGERGYAAVSQEPARFGPEFEAMHVMAAVGLLPGDADSERPPQLVSTGLDTLVAPVASDEALSRAAPDFALIEGLADMHDFNLYLVHVSLGGKRARARMFTRLVAGGEDPATGSAAGPLGAYLAERDGVDRVEIVQGVELGRPSRLLAERQGDRVVVGGDVVLVAEGEVLL